MIDMVDESFEGEYFSCDGRSGYGSSKLLHSGAPIVSVALITRFIEGEEQLIIQLSSTQVFVSYFSSTRQITAASTQCAESSLGVLGCPSRCLLDWLGITCSALCLSAIHRGLPWRFAVAVSSPWFSLKSMEQIASSSVKI